MALQKQNIPLSVTDGIDTKTDEKNVLATRWLKAENVVFTESMAANKDPGFTALTQDVDGASALASGNAIAKFNDELIQYSDNKLYSYSKSKAKWYDKGFVSNAVAESKAIVVTDITVAQIGYVALSNIGCYVYKTETLGNSFYARIVDEQTGSILFDHTITGSTPTFMKVGTVGTNFVIIYFESGNTKYRAISMASLGTVGSAVTLGPAASQVADCCLIQDRLFIIWKNDVSGADLLYLDASLVASAITNIAFVFVDWLGLSKENVNTVRVVCNDNTTAYDYNLAGQLHAPAVFSSGFTPRGAKAIQDPDTAASSIILYHDDADAGQIGIKKSTVSSAGTVTFQGFIMYAVNPISKPQILNGQVYIVVAKRLNDSASLGSRTFFLISIDGQIIAKVSDEIGVRAYAPQELYVSGNTLSFLGAEYYQFFNAAAPDTSTSTVLKKHTFDFTKVNNYFDAILGRQLHVAGGVLYSYDADRVTEHGFLEIPLEPSAAIADINPTPGVGDSAVAYPQIVQYCLVYAWNDSQGQIHRSAPSIPHEVSIPDSTTKVTLTVRPLTLTSKENVEIEVYRTEANGTTFYKVSSLAPAASVNNGRLNNDPSAATIDFVDNQPDGAIIDKEILYTTGGILENHAPYSTRYVVSNKSRLFLLGSDGYSIQYSLLKEGNVGVGFNGALVTPLDSIGGPGKALAILDENLVIFKEDSILYQAGEGPNNLGEQNDFRQPVNIPSDVGVQDPASVVATPMGILFKSKKGIYILRRNLSLDYIGAPVEGYNDLEITSANLLANVNQVRFTTSSGTCLIYDYFHNRWSTRAGISAVDALIYEDCFTYLKSNGQVLQQGPAVWGDNGTYIPMTLESSWIQVGNVQGYQRFYRMLIAGDYKSAHQIKVSFAYNFSDSYVDSVTIDATDEFDDGTPYQFEVMPKIQKCEAFKFKIETLTDGVLGADASLSNFMLVVGVKPTTNKGAAQFAAS